MAAGMAAGVAAEKAARFEQDLDRAAAEVFSMMMGVSCAPVERAEPEGEETLSAVIGLAGALSGSMVLRCGRAAALEMTERLTGVAPAAVDAMVRDAVGEVCNMVAGAWKGFDRKLVSGCLLSTPTVVAGTSYEFFGQRSPIRVERCYGFAGAALTLTLFCELPS